LSKTYVPLYRKYRPQTFLDLIGQENITQALSNAIKLNKVAHAYLFCGPRGTGKTSSARILAKSLNCVNGPTIEPCGKCPSCVDITNSTPVDVIEIDAASNRSVEDAQNILEKIQYVPIHGKYKIYIIDEVHMLSTTAFNALLKTLEEPPENVVFILATTEAHKVLETIVSRCQRFDFRRITVDDIVKRLEYISEKENINISKDALYAIAKSAQGGMRDALALLDQLSILDVQKQIDVEDVENLLGKISINVLFDLTEKIISNSPQEAVLEINKVYAKGNEPLQILSNLIEYFRNLLIIKTCTDSETILNLTQLNEDLIKKLTPQAQSIDTSVINYVIDRLAAYLREIKNAQDRYLWLEVCIIELSNKLSTVGFSDLVGRIEALEKAISSGVQLAPRTQSPQVRPAIQSAPAPQPVQQPQPQVQPPKTEPAADIESNEPAKPVLQADVPPKTVEPELVIKEEEHVISPADAVIAEESVHTAQQMQPAPASTPAQSSENGLELWDSLLSNFSSLPSKMFFANLSCPVMITPDKVVIGFTKDIFVSQSREAGRMNPLKSAIQGLFGNSDMPVEIRLISEAEANEFKSGIKKKSDVAPAPQKPSEQPKTASSNEEDEEEEFYEKQLAEKNGKKPSQPKVYSDQAKMIMDLFNGKYMD